MCVVRGAWCVGERAVPRTTDNAPRTSSKGTQSQKVQRSMATRNRPDQDLCGRTARARFLDQPIPGTNGIRGEHTDAEDLMLTDKQCRAMHRTAAGSQLLGELANGIGHLTSARRPDRR